MPPQLFEIDDLTIILYLAISWTSPILGDVHLDVSPCTLPIIYTLLTLTFQCSPPRVYYKGCSP